MAVLAPTLEQIIAMICLAFPDNFAGVAECKQRSTALFGGTVVHFKPLSLCLLA